MLRLHKSANFTSDLIGRVPWGWATFHSGITAPIRSWVVTVIGLMLIVSGVCLRLKDNHVPFLLPSWYVSCFSILSFISGLLRRTPTVHSHFKTKPKGGPFWICLWEKVILNLGIPEIRTPCQVLLLGISLRPFSLSMAYLILFLEFGMIKWNPIGHNYCYCSYTWFYQEYIDSS